MAYFVAPEQVLLIIVTDVAESVVIPAALRPESDGRDASDPRDGSVFVPLGLEPDIVWSPCEIRPVIRTWWLTCAARLTPLSATIAYCLPAPIAELPAVLPVPVELPGVVAVPELEPDAPSSTLVKTKRPAPLVPVPPDPAPLVPVAVDPVPVVPVAVDPVPVVPVAVVPVPLVPAALVPDDVPVDAAPMAASHVLRQPVTVIVLSSERLASVREGVDGCVVGV
jgi:hypothetical protein